MRGPRTLAELEHDLERLSPAELDAALGRGDLLPGGPLSLNPSPQPPTTRWARLVLVARDSKCELPSPPPHA